MTKGELIELLIGYPDDAPVQIDLGDPDAVDPETYSDGGTFEIVSVQEDGGTIYLCPLEEEDEPEPESQVSGNVIDADFRVLKPHRRKSA